MQTHMQLRSQWSENTTGKRGPHSSNEERVSCQEADDAALVFTAWKERWGREGEGEREREREKTLCSPYIIGDFKSIETPVSTPSWVNAGVSGGHKNPK